MTFKSLKKKNTIFKKHKHETRHKNVVKDIIFHLTKPQLHYLHEDEILSN